jgi:AcrR family transcriptional regulator
MPRPLPPGVMATTGGEHDAVRDLILDATHRVISTQGLAAASTRAIAEEAGVGVGTLYNYAEDRLELVVDAMLRHARIVSEPLEKLSTRAGKGTVARNLRRFAHEVGEVLDGLIPMFAAAFSDAQLLEALRRAISTHQGTGGPFTVHPIESYLLAERELGRVAPDADCRSAVSLILGLCHERAFLDYFTGRTGRRRSISREIDLIARAISPPTAGATSAPSQPSIEGSHHAR